MLQNQRACQLVRSKTGCEPLALAVAWGACTAGRCAAGVLGAELPANAPYYDEGRAFGMLEEQLGADKKILRVMPNTLIQSGNGYSAACINPNVNDDDKVIITTVLNALGQTMYVTENMFETFTAFCCTGPIWFYKTVEALIDAGVYAGFSRAESRAMVIKNMLGVAQVLDATGAHPALKVDDMTSPAGVTIEALQVLHQERFTGALMTSVDAAVKKANSIH